MSANKHGKRFEGIRSSPRIYSVKEISVSYEGHTEEVAIRPPDVSTHGMFISTARTLPMGAVLNLRFRLALSDVEICTRCEVRYCLPGVGVEFIGIAPEAVRQIEYEILLCTRPRRRRKAVKIT